MDACASRCCCRAPCALSCPPSACTFACACSSAPTNGARCTAAMAAVTRKDWSTCSAFPWPSSTAWIARIMRSCTRTGSVLPGEWPFPVAPAAPALGRGSMLKRHLKRSAMKSTLMYLACLARPASAASSVGKLAAPPLPAANSLSKRKYTSKVVSTTRACTSARARSERSASASLRSRAVSASTPFLPFLAFFFFFFFSAAAWALSLATSPHALLRRSSNCSETRQRTSAAGEPAPRPRTARATAITASSVASPEALSARKRSRSDAHAASRAPSTRLAAPFTSTPITSRRWLKWPAATTRMPAQRADASARASSLTPLARVATYDR
mmetsp:Transcript_6832/g.27942  ORF Transcript_6832/g.27942 Transcript_6832/m.27942 type:complete len:328 (+) Transcript_6832:695-1678(+)